MQPKAISREGFTMLEILVILLLLGLLIGAIVPNILSQTSKGEVNRVVRDLANVESAAKTFRVDVSRWPADLSQLQSAITTSDEDINGNTYPAGLTNRWSGPYLEAVEASTDSLETAAGGLISGFSKGCQIGGSEGCQLNGEDYLVMTLTGLPLEHVGRLDVEVDGAESSTKGRVRSDSATVYYLAAPIQ